MTDVWYMLKDPNRYVYHYTREQRVINIVENEQLRLSPFKHVNDPREQKDWTFGYFAAVSTIDPSPELRESINERLKHTCRIGCFSSDTEDAVVTPLREAQGADIDHASYHRGHSRPTLWWFYGDEHAGACLVFDRQKLDTAIRSAVSNLGCNVYCAHVQYEYPRVVVDPWKPHELIISNDTIEAEGVDAAIATHLSKHWRQLFFVKASDWSTEREYRWLVTDFRSGDLFADTRDSLVGILLGEQSSSDLKRAASEAGKLHGVRIAIMHWQNGFPQPSPVHWRMLAAEAA